MSNGDKMNNEQYLFILGHLFLAIGILYSLKDSPVMYVYYFSATALILMGVACMVFRWIEK